MNMRNLAFAVISILVLASCGCIKTAETTDIQTFPKTESGYELGVSACFAGCIGDKLVMAGGCNFPTPGKKKYYQGIYVADVSEGELNWTLAGNLPEPVAYGVSIVSGDSLIFIGGNNTEKSLTTVYSVHLNGGKTVVKTLNSLPCSIDNMAGAISGNDIFVFGGNQDGKASGKLLKMSLKTGEWTEEASIPSEPRVQPVCAAVGDMIYIWGGFFSNGEASKVHTDGYAYNTKSKTWTLLPEPKDAEGNTLTVSGGTATTVGKNILCLGGVNKDIFVDAISGRYTLVKKEDYLKKEPSWYRFNPNMLMFDTQKNAWKIITPKSDKFARAGAIIVPTNDYTLLYYIGGELKPSVRTPIIERIKLK